MSSQIVIDPRAKERLYADTQRPINQARVRAAAWILGVAGAQAILQQQRNKLYECTEDVALLRERMNVVAEQRSAPQQQCLAQLDAALTNYSASAERSEACLVLLEEYLASFERQLAKHTSRLDTQTKRIRATKKLPRIGEIGDIVAATSTRRRNAVGAKHDET